MKARLIAWRDRVDELQPKERALVLVATLVVLGAAWQKLLMDPLELERRLLQNDINRHQARIADLDQQAVKIVEVSRNDPNEPLRRQIASAEAQTASFEREIRDRAGQLIAPDEMSGILKSVLEQTRGLRFLSLEGLGAEPLLPAGKDAGADGGNGARTAYRHGFRIRFAGSYLDTIDYLRALESLPWRFFWDAVEVDVKKHPDATCTVVVYTLSLDRRWIGV